MSIDGVDQYEMLFSNASSARSEMLLNLWPAGVYYGLHRSQQAAYRMRQWKLIVGAPNCSMIDFYIPFEDPCPTGCVLFATLHHTHVCTAGCMSTGQRFRPLPRHPGSGSSTWTTIHLSATTLLSRTQKLCDDVIPVIGCHITLAGVAAADAA